MTGAPIGWSEEMATTRKATRPPQAKRARPPEPPPPPEPPRERSMQPRDTSPPPEQPALSPPARSAPPYSEPVTGETRPDGHSSMPVETVTSTDGAAAEPTLPPPEVEAAAEVWHRDTHITGLWAINEQRNAWVSVPDLGWKQLSNSSEGTCLALAILAAHAKQQQSLVNLRLDSDDQIQEMYVW